MNRISREKLKVLMNLSRDRSPASSKQLLKFAFDPKEHPQAVMFAIGELIGFRLSELDHFLENADWKVPKPSAVVLIEMIGPRLLFSFEKRAEQFLDEPDMFWKVAVGVYSATTSSAFWMTSDEMRCAIEGLTEADLGAFIASGLLKFEDRAKTKRTLRRCAKKLRRWELETPG